jgi:hypothetical protein
VVKASGQSLLLALGTGEGPLILGQTAWARIAARMPLAPGAGTAGELYSSFSATATPALFFTLPSLTLLQGSTDSAWLGACAELARARRIEWVLANQDQGACFQPCDVSDGHAITTRPYADLGGPLVVAVVDESSAIMQSLSVDLGGKPQIDGIVGAATLAGTRLRVDYPSSRVVVSCIDANSRQGCFAAPPCPGLSSQGQTHVCFGDQPRGYAPVCK